MKRGIGEFETSNIAHIVGKEKANNNFAIITPTETKTQNEFFRTIREVCPFVFDSLANQPYKFFKRLYAKKNKSKRLDKFFSK